MSVAMSQKKLHKLDAKSPRTIELTLRVNAYEHELIKQRQTEKTMSKWLRNLALNSKPSALSKADPDLIRHIGRIGSNLNQIAKYANINERLDKQTLNEITAIRKELHKLIESNLKNTKGGVANDC